jgi:riboflavin biosynthesis pyrimidine reductase
MPSAMPSTRRDPVFEVLFDAPDLPTFDLPGRLRSAYGPFGLPERVLFANFVSSLDGAVALPAVPKASTLIGGRHPADRFVMALLRSVADAVLLGAGTYREHRGPWTAEKAEAATDLAELRAAIGATPTPALVVVTRSGDLGPPRDFAAGTVIVTTDRGRERLDAHRDAGAEVVVPGGDEPIDAAPLMALLRSRGLSRILTEGGPTLMGDLLRARVVDELFLTLSPVVLGSGPRGATTLAGGADLVAAPARAERLLSVRRSDGYLFVRYEMAKEVER